MGKDAEAEAEAKRGAEWRRGVLNENGCGSERMRGEFPKSRFDVASVFGGAGVFTRVFPRVKQMAGRGSRNSQNLGGYRTNS